MKDIFRKIYDSAVFSVVAGLLIFLIASILSETVIAGVISSSCPDTPFWKTGKSYLDFLGIWIFFILVMLVFPKCRPYLKKLGPDSGNTPKLTLFGALAGFATNFICILFAMLTKKITLASFQSHPVLELLLLLLFVCIQSGAEELICRLYLYQRIKQKYPSEIPSIIIPAALFSLMHIYNEGVTPLALINIFEIGIVYALIIYYFDAFWVCVMCHTLWNYTQNIIFGLPNSGKPSVYSMFPLLSAAEQNSFFYNREFGVESTGTALCVNFLFLAAVIYFGEKKKPFFSKAKPTEQEMFKN